MTQELSTHACVDRNIAGARNNYFAAYGSVEDWMGRHWQLKDSTSTKGVRLTSCSFLNERDFASRLYLYLCHFVS